MTDALEKLPVDRKARLEKVNALLRRADEGDPRATRELREIADAVPAIWDEMGDLAAQVEYKLLDAVSGKNTLAREAIARKVRGLRRELADPNSSPLERLLVERIGCCWLHLQVVEAIYTQNMSRLTLAQGDYHQRRVDRAQKRYLAAIRALAQVRRLELPAVQVNIGEKQINVVQPPERS